MTAKEEYRKKLKSERWVETAARIRKRDGNRCRRCGGKSFLHVHHLRYCGADPWDTPDEYLVTRCRWCHKREHGLEDPWLVVWFRRIVGVSVLIYALLLILSWVLLQLGHTGLAKIVIGVPLELMFGGDV